jgi:hypothetical protein
MSENPTPFEAAMGPNFPDGLGNVDPPQLPRIKDVSQTYHQPLPRRRNGEAGRQAGLLIHPPVVIFRPGRRG